MKQNVWPFVLMAVGVLLTAAGIIWQLAIQAEARYR